MSTTWDKQEEQFRVDREHIQAVTSNNRTTQSLMFAKHVFKILHEYGKLKYPVAANL